MDNRPAIAVRAANYFKKMGRFDDAILQVDYAVKSVKAPTPQFYANMMLLKGVIELDRGKWDVATRLFRQADAAFPGYWRIKAHLAQMTALGGDLDGAERQYRNILAQAGSDIAMPEVIDALAALYRSRGNAKSSRYLAARAGAIWINRLAQLPEAAYGHALEHELVLGNPARALDLARLNLAARPYGDSSTMLAMALLANGRYQEAVDILNALERSGWRTAQQYVVLSQAWAMLGQVQASENARTKALALNPRAFDPASSFIWFGNH
jgi:predicted Zn-dependent protease